MATWKEKGEVPDSDDDDAEDSQSLTANGERDCGLQNPREHAGDQRDAQRGIGNDQQKVFRRQSPVAASPTPVLQSFGEGPPVFKAPSTLSQLDDEFVERLQGQMFTEDEVSKSYVSLSSSLSSLPSSNSPSPVKGHLSPRDTGAYIKLGTSNGSREEMRPDMDLWGDACEGNQGDTFVAPVRRRRSLRERNPIQIHPFLIEEEKYRRTLKASNLKPLRLTQVQQEPRKSGRKEVSPDPDFDTQDESQNPALEPKSVLPQSASQLSVLEKSSDTLSSPRKPDSPLIDKDDDNEDDEFPEIDELLNKAHDAFVNLHPVPRSLPHNNRVTSRLPSKRTRSPLAPTKERRNTGTDVFVVPPSPPTTSSPLPTLLHFNERKDLRSVVSASTPSRSTSPEHPSSQKERRAGNLPTPSTNTAKHTIDLTLMEVGENSPTASESDSVMSSSSESDRSSQIRHVGKKIRGVLPASWLRLDRKSGNSIEAKNTNRQNRRSRSLSPARVPPRRGVAVPKDVHITSSLRSRNQPDPYFLSDESEGDDLTGLPRESSELLDVDDAYSNENTQSVVEEDHVDAMLQSRKRQAALLPRERRRKVRRMPNSFPPRAYNSRPRQPKITEHLIAPQVSDTTSNHKKKRQGTHGDRPTSRRLTSLSQHVHSKVILPPKLSILDVIQRAGDNRDDNPRFIRIAARNARLRTNLGRHSPTHKFIRLANRADTLDAQLSLREWREGTIPPKVELGPLKHSSSSPKIISSMSLESKGIKQNPKQLSDVDQFWRSNIAFGVRKLLIRKPRQTQINWPTESQPVIMGSVAKEWLPEAMNRSNLTSFKKLNRSLRTTIMPRPAQLETSSTEYNNRHPNLAFRSTKRTLDALYKKSRRDSAPRKDIRMARFLADDELDAKTVVAKTLIKSSNLEGHHKASKGKGVSHDAHRCRKRPPMRIDAGAAEYQQPSEPLILDYLEPTAKHQAQVDAEGKLAGLGSVGTQYTSHFNIFPLPLGVYFHKSTFLGSGLFSEILESPTIELRLKQRRIHKDYELAEKVLRWGPWDDLVSSELGICFDWIIEQLDAVVSANSSTDMGITKCLTFMIEYTHRSLEFPSEMYYEGCLSRFIEVLDIFTGHIRKLALDIKLGTSPCINVFIDVLTLAIVLIFQLLRISRIGIPIIEATHQLEDLLQKVTTIAVQLLLLIGLECIRNLYDDLQYLNFRESGIKPDRCVTQAWVVVMHILRMAQIPRFSFWDVVNSQLIPEHAATTNDARVFERVWYVMYSLLPLVEFDKLGVLIPGLRHSMSFENWSLPQRMVKRIFELYISRSRQLPSFNDYCRALFCRCFHLIQVWGWQRYSSIIGTLFDFFASQKLSHFRNEDAYRSPRFLEELDREPSLAVEPEDRCFHILLKIIATSINQLRSVGDLRGIRNLVARVLPNNDRQYPKEETITQRDLASLRNNHDLLCTLFWAAPSNLRPPISLLCELVNPEQSHREAYLINLEAWRNLARFILSSSSEPSVYEPLREWQTKSSELLLAQYLSLDKDIEQQLARLSEGAKRLISQDTINKTLRKNREHIRAALNLQMGELLRLMRDVPTMDEVNLLLDIRLLWMYLSLILCELDFEHESTDVSLTILCTYLEELHKRVPLNPTLPVPEPIEEDSQTYGSDSGFIELANPRSKYIEVLIPRVFDAVRRVVQRTLHSHSPLVPLQLELSKEAIRVWAFLAATLVTGGFHELSDYFATSGKYAEITLDSQSVAVRGLTGQFLLQVLEFGGGLLSVKNLGRDPLYDYLCFLIMPGIGLRELDVLITHYAACEPALVLGARGSLIGPYPESEDEVRLNWKHYNEEDSARRRLTIAEEIFANMRKVLRDGKTVGEFYPSQTLSEVRKRYEDVVSNVSDQITSITRFMNEKSPENAKPEGLLMEVQYQMVVYFFPDIQLPHHNFPDLFNFKEGTNPFISSLRFYGLQLESDRGKSTLFYYCMGAIKKAAIEGEKHTMTEMLLKATNSRREMWAELSEQLFGVITPALLHNAFTSEIGWFLLGPFIEAAKQEILNTPEKRRSFAIAKRILRTVINGLMILSCSHRDRPRRLATGYIETLILMTRFVNEIMERLLSLADIYDKGAETKSWLSIYLKFAVDAIAYLRSPFRVHIDYLCSARSIQDPISDPCLEKLIHNYESIFLSDVGVGQRKAAADAAADEIIIHIGGNANRESVEKSRRVFWDLVAGPKYQVGQHLFWRIQQTWTDDKIKEAGFSYPPILNKPIWADQVLDELIQNWQNSGSEGEETISVRDGQQCHVVYSMPKAETAVVMIHEELQKELETLALFHRKFTMPRAKNARTRALGYERPNYDLVL